MTFSSNKTIKDNTWDLFNTIEIIKRIFFPKENIITNSNPRTMTSRQIDIFPPKAKFVQPLRRRTPSLRARANSSYTRPPKQHTPSLLSFPPLLCYHYCNVVEVKKKVRKRERERERVSFVCVCFCATFRSKRKGTLGMLSPIQTVARFRDASISHASFDTSSCFLRQQSTLQDAFRFSCELRYDGAKAYAHPKENSK